jgi:hypothetical protein
MWLHDVTLAKFKVHLKLSIMILINILKLFPQNIQTVSPAHQAPCSMGTGFFLLTVKWPGRETDLIPSTNAEVKNEYLYFS